MPCSPSAPPNWKRNGSVFLTARRAPKPANTREHPQSGRRASHCAHLAPAVPDYTPIARVCAELRRQAGGYSVANRPGPADAGPSFKARTTGPGVGRRQVRRTRASALLMRMRIRIVPRVVATRHIQTQQGQNREKDEGTRDFVFHDETGFSSIRLKRRAQTGHPRNLRLCPPAVVP